MNAARRKKNLIDRLYFPADGINRPRRERVPNNSRPRFLIRSAHQNTARSTGTSANAYKYSLWANRNMFMEVFSRPFVIRTLQAVKRILPSLPRCKILLYDGGIALLRFSSFPSDQSPRKSFLMSGCRLHENTFHSFVLQFFAAMLHRFPQAYSDTECRTVFARDTEPRRWFRRQLCTREYRMFVRYRQPSGDQSIPYYSHR